MQKRSEEFKGTEVLQKLKFSASKEAEYEHIIYHILILIPIS